VVRVIVKLNRQHLYNFYILYNVFNLTKSFFQNKPIDQFPDNTRQEHDDGNCINGMHHLKVKTGGPVWISLSEKIHEQI